jgi:hypothetical protein
VSGTTTHERGAALSTALLLSLVETLVLIFTNSILKILMINANQGLNF